MKFAPCRLPCYDSGMDGKLSNSLCHGVVRNGVIVLSPGESLPEGTAVTVTPEPLLESDTSPAPRLDVPRRNGVPIFPTRPGASVDLDLVNKLRDDVE